LRRLAGTVVALAAAAVFADWDAVTVMALESGATDRGRALRTNERRVDVQQSGITTILTGHFVAWLPAIPTAPLAPSRPLRCNFDQPRGLQVCTSRNATDSSALTRTVAYRSGNGTVEARFNNASTDTVTVTAGFVNTTRDSSGIPVNATLRSEQRFTGTSRHSDSRVLNGADTITVAHVFTADAPRSTRRIIVYSNVTMPNDREARYPTAGVVHVTTTTANSRHEGGSSELPTSMIVCFDGSRTPVVYLDGIRYRLDLLTDIATPFGDD
jgi:hypothetical protein